MPDPHTYETATAPASRHASAVWARCRALAPIVSICALAFALRAPAIRAQLPDEYWHDELNLVEGALRVGVGEIVGASYGGYSHGTLTYYVLFVAFGIYFVLGRLAGVFRGPDDFVMSYVTHPSSVFLVARGVMLIVSIATIALTFALARRIFGRLRAGLVAATLLAVSFQSVQITFGKEDGLFTVIVVAAVTFALVMVDRPVHWRRFAILGALFGAAAAVKYFGVLATPVIIVTARYSGGGRQPWREVVRLSTIAAAAFALAFVCFVPGVLLDTHRFMYSLRQLAVINTGTLFSDVAVAVSRWYGYLWNTFATANGWPMAALFYVASFWMLRRRFQQAAILLLYPAILTGLLTGMLLFGRPAEATNFYQVSILPLLCVAAGGLLDVLWARGRTSVRLAIGAVVAIMVGTNVADDIRFQRLLHAEDSRTAARRWIEGHVPTGSSILVEGAIYTFVLEGPQLGETTASLERSLAEIRQQGGGGRLWAVKLRAAEHAAGARFDVRKVPDLTTQLLVERPSFVVVRNDRSRQLVEADGRYRRIFAVEPDSPKAFQFVPLFSSADIARLRRIPIVASDPGVTPGPAIRVYQYLGRPDRTGNKS